MQAIILAGGMGTRLRPLTYTLPKPMLPVAGRPAIAHIVEALARAGCNDVIITTNYLAPLVEERLKRLPFPIAVRCVEEFKPLGTAGCVRNLWDDLEDEFLIIQGDAVADIDYAAFLAFHKQKQADVSIAVMRVADTREFGVCDLDSNGRIRRFQEKPRPEDAVSDLASSGFYILKKSMFREVPEGEPFDFARELFPRLMEQDARFFGWPLNGFWIDIGRVGTYLSANTRLIEGHCAVAPDAQISPDAVCIAPFTIGAGSKIASGARVGPGTVIGAGCFVGEGARVVGSVVYDEVSLGAHVQLNGCVVGARCRVGRDARVEEGAVVGEGCDIGAGAVVGPQTRLGPLVPLAPGALLEGVLEPRPQKLDALARALGSGRALASLLPDEREVHALLTEGGDLSARDIADATAIPLFRVLAVLHSLERRHLIGSNGEQPPHYSLTQVPGLLPRRFLIVQNALESGQWRALLARGGHSVRTASDGVEAVEAVRDERFDAILMDAELPSLSGWDAARLIRGVPNGRTVPLVLFTSGRVDEADARAEEVGARGVFPRDAPAEALLPHVLELLGR